MTPTPPGWAVMAQAIAARCPVRARYHGLDRLICPHVLGWKNGRPRVLAYQSGGTTSTGALPVASSQRWRSMFLDELEDPVLTEGAWETADNYSLATNSVDQIELAVPSHR